MKITHVTVLSAIVACALFTSAGAHIVVTPLVASAGSVTELTFRCPNERPDSATTQFTVQMPEDFPLARVEVRPLNGWHYAVTMRALQVPIRGARGKINSVVDTITWSGSKIRPGERQQFVILVGPLPPGAHELAFKALQTFENGDVTRWVELRNPGEAAPLHPAPILHVQ